MKLDRIRVFTFGEEPCEKFYFKNKQLIKIVDGTTEIFGEKIMINIIKIFLDYKLLRGHNIDKIIIDEIEKSEL